MTTAKHRQKNIPTTITNGEAKPLSLETKTNPAVAPAAGAMSAAD
jgi:hypothetical protein